ncbi:MAG: hypothetical protein O9301_04380 [Leptospira sp.]|nr:hypothetical protein [Leptospira sp.]
MNTISEKVATVYSGYRFRFLGFNSILGLLFLFLSISPLYSTAVCIGLECSSLSRETILLSNLANPVLGEIYTDKFLSSMGQSAVLQNINSAMLGGNKVERNRIGIGYSMARTKVSALDYFENTELRDLPRLGVAASPSLSYRFNLGYALGLTGEWQKWDISFHFFPYYLSETNIPFLKIRNTDVSGRVLNSGLNARYFPFFTSDANAHPYLRNLSFGLGIYQTNQEIYLFAYDRRPTQFRIDGDTRRWIGINQLTYTSILNSATADVRYAFSPFQFFSVYTGLGLVYNQGITRIRVERYAAISSSENRDDFSTNPSSVGLDFRREYRLRNSNGYGILGVQFFWNQISIGLEYLRNQSSESLNLGVQYSF